MAAPVYAELNLWLASLDDSTVVLTPNRRLSRFIQQQYARYRDIQGQLAWPSLPCHVMSGWVQGLWVQLQQAAWSGTDRALLTSVQEAILWEQIIRQHSQGYELLNPRQTAAVAMDAWHKLLNWQLVPEQLRGRQMDQVLFRRWSVHYRDFCHTRKLTDSSQILEIIRQAVAAGSMPLPKRIDLYGFDVIKPLERALLDSFATQGVRVQPVDFMKTAQVRHIALEDENAEIITAARWAADLLTQQPNAADSISIGIVVPQLTTSHARVERLFQNVFEPQHLLVSNARHVAGFNISVAQPLKQMPLVQAALQALQLNRRELEMEQVSQVLRSPFIASLQELPRRALLEADLRAQLLTLRPARLRAAAGAQRGASGPRCPDLFRRLQEFYNLGRNEQVRRRPPGEWVTVFAAQLSALGWPGERTLDSLEFQQLQLWREVLANLGGLDAVCGPCNAETAISYLEQLLQHAPFHARTSDSPVQILGLLEAAGMLFDHVWVMQMDNQSWPQLPQPNPLLPIRQQAELGMPGGSVVEELQYARTLTKRLAGSAGQVLFSYSRFRGDAELQPSPLLEEYSAITSGELPLIMPVDYYRELYQTAALVAETDRYGPRITDPASVRGGTQILKDQAACQFRSFARHRLRAREIEQAQPGISALDHGLLLHKVLEIIWRRIQSQEPLLQFNQDELVELIQSAISEGFSTMPADWLPGQRLRLLESRRLFALLSDWLELEKQRRPFTVLLSESETELQLAGLPLRVRYDRIDELADGGWFVIDYKTGQARIGDWAGPRPDEPQIPIYCLANEQRISGAAFGVLNAKETAFKGVAITEDIAPGIITPAALSKVDLPRDWRGILQHWRSVLEVLAREFIEGAAAVDPKSIASSCRYCALPGLCRIAESVKTGVTDQAEEAENVG